MSDAAEKASKARRKKVEEEAPPAAEEKPLEGVFVIKTLNEEGVPGVALSPQNVSPFEIEKLLEIALALAKKEFRIAE